MASVEMDMLERILRTVVYGNVFICLSLAGLAVLVVLVMTMLNNIARTLNDLVKILAQQYQDDEGVEG